MIKDINKMNKSGTSYYTHQLREAKPLSIGVNILILIINKE